MTKVKRMEREIDELRARSKELAAVLGDDEALEVNAEILDLDPGDPVATNRLGIGLINRGRHQRAVEVLELGVRVHPDNTIMVKRLEQARKALATGAKPVSGGGGGGTGPGTGWTDFEVKELVESSLGGPGRDAAMRMCGRSLRMSEAIDAQRTAVTPVKNGHRFRVIGGIFTGVAPWGDMLSVAVPVHAKQMIARAMAVGAMTGEPAKAVPCVELLIPRSKLVSLLDDLIAAHREHLHLSLEYAPPTHLNKHHEGLRHYVLEQSARLDA